MGKGTKRRKRPGRHTVHTKDSRYNVPSYPRGEGDLVTRESNTLVHGRLKSRCTNCGHIFYGSTIEYHQVCPKCKKKSGVPYHGSYPVNTIVRPRDLPLDKATIIYANDEKDARSKVEARFGKVKKVEPLGVNHMGNPYFRVTYISKSEEFKEFKRYIAISPNAKELNLTEKEIVAHPRLTKAQKKTLYQHIRARSGNLPNPKKTEYLTEHEKFAMTTEDGKMITVGVPTNLPPESEVKYFETIFNSVKNESNWKAPTRTVTVNTRTEADLLARSIRHYAGGAEVEDLGDGKFRVGSKGYYHYIGA